MTRVDRGERSWRLYTAALVALDVLAIVLAFWLAYEARYLLRLFALAADTAGTDRDVALVAIAVPIWLLIFMALGLYRRGTLLSGPREYGAVVNACTVGFAAVAVISFLGAGAAAVSRGWIVTSWPLAIVTVGAGRVLMRRLAHALRGRGLSVTRMAILGANAQAWRSHGSSGRRR